MNIIDDGRMDVVWIYFSKAVDMVPYDRQAEKNMSPGTYGELTIWLGLVMGEGHDGRVSLCQQVYG